LADPVLNKQWIAYFEEKGAHVLEINSKSGAGIKSIHGMVQEACREKIERDRKRGIVNRPVRAMVVGIPNVGKSTFINSFAGKACTKTGNKPGVTKGKQWIRLNKNLELLDTPGILWPKFEDQEVGMKLAFIGSINDEIIIMDELASDLIGTMQKLYPRALAERYSIVVGEETSAEILEKIAESRKCYSKGDSLDLEKAAAILMDDFRSGRLGRITLEQP
jgi:ribosome biogenesis GTPase A